MRRVLSLTAIALAAVTTPAFGMHSADASSSARSTPTATFAVGGNPRFLDRATAYGVVEAFNFAFCWDCEIGTHACYRFRPLRVDCTGSGEGATLATVVRLRGRVIELGTYPTRDVHRGDVRRSPYKWEFRPKSLDRLWKAYRYPQGYRYSEYPIPSETPYGRPRLRWLVRLQ
jgi:hypothetical protein